MFIRDLLQPTHLIIILVIVLLIIGPGKLTGLGGALGSSIRDFKRATKDEDEGQKDTGPVKSVADDDEEPVRVALPARSVVADAAPLRASHVSTDDEDEMVTVPAGQSMSGVVNETGTAIKVGTTRKSYGRR